MYFLIFCMGLIYICTNNLMKDSSISRIKGLILFFRGWRRLFFFFLDHALITTGWRWVYIKYKCFHCASSFHLMWYISSDRFWFKVFQMKMQGNLGNGFWKFLPLLNPPSWRPGTGTSASLETLYCMFIFILMEKLSSLAFHISNPSKACSNGLW